MKLIVFDIDDTITKSEFQHQTAYVNTMIEFGIKKINKDWKSYTHHTDSFILKENYESNFSTKFDFNFISAFENRMTERIQELKPVTEIFGARDMINQLLTQKDYAMTFATGSLRKPALIKLSQADIKYQDELVVGSNSIYEREGIVKTSIENAKRFHQVEQFDSIISVGDGIWDLKTAKNLGIHFMGIGLKNYTDFQKFDLQHHINDWSKFNLGLFDQIFGESQRK